MAPPLDDNGRRLRLSIAGGVRQPARAGWPRRHRAGSPARRCSRAPVSRCSEGFGPL